MLVQVLKFWLQLIESLMYSYAFDPTAVGTSAENGGAASAHIPLACEQRAVLGIHATGRSGRARRTAFPSAREARAARECGGAHRPSALLRAINERSTDSMRHNDAKAEILRSGDQMQLLLELISQQNSPKSPRIQSMVCYRLKRFPHFWVLTRRAVARLSTVGGQRGGNRKFFNFEKNLRKY